MERIWTVRMIKMMLWMMLANIVIVLSSCQQSLIESQNVSLDPTSEQFQKTIITISITNDRLTPAMIAEFEQSHPSISIQRVEPKHYYMTNYEKSLEQLDIISVMAEDLPYYVRRGLALNLSPYIDHNPAFVEPMFPQVANLMKFDQYGVQGNGDYFGFLQGWSPGYFLLYNKSLFDFAGISYPSDDEPLTWNQLLHLAEQLTIGSDGQTKQYGFGIAGQKTIDYALYMMQMEQLDKSPWYDDFNKADFTSDESRQIFQYWNHVLQANLGPNPINQDTKLHEQLFIENQLAMLLVDYGLVMQLGNDKPYSYGIAPAPVYEQSKQVIPVLTDSAALIHSKTKHPEEAWTVFEWLFTNEPKREWISNGNELPVFISDMESIARSTDWNQMISIYMNDYIPQSSPLLHFNYYLSAGAVNNLFDKYLVPVSFGKSELMMALYAMTQDANFQIEDGKLSITN